MGLPALYTYSWFYKWSGERIWSSKRLLVLAGRCEGCDKVSAIKHTVLSLFLWKLGVEIKP